MSKKLRSWIAPIVTAVAAPYLGPVGGALLGGAGGALSGGGIKGALLGAASGGIGGLPSSTLGGLVGLQGAGADALKGAISGGLGGASSGGGLKAALIGAGLGGAGGYALGGGIPSLGTPAGAPLAGGVGPTQGSGFVGDVTRGASNIAGGGLSSLTKFGTPLTNIASGINTYMAQGDAEDKLLEAQGRAAGAISPYNQSGLRANQMLDAKLSSGELGGSFNPGDLTNDPGYQFRLKEGEDAINRKLSASGGVFSGAALRAAQDYGQGLADQTYNDAYQRWLQGQQNTYGMLSGQSSQGLGAAGAMADIYGNEGNIQANTGMAQSNTLTGVLSGALRGSGAIVGYDKDWNPIYRDSVLA